MKIIFIIIGTIGFLWILIFFSGIKILLSEFKVEPSDHYYIEEYRDIVESGEDSLVCKYFNGFGIVKRVFKYSYNNKNGIDTCPFLLRD